MLLMMTVFIGCGNEKKLTDINADEITSISVIFDDEEGITNTVTVDDYPPHTRDFSRE